MGTGSRPDNEPANHRPQSIVLRLYGVRTLDEDLESDITTSWCIVAPLLFFSITFLLPGSLIHGPLY